jgi:hypothetical protein
MASWCSPLEPSLPSWAVNLTKVLGSSRPLECIVLAKASPLSWLSFQIDLGFLDGAFLPELSLTKSVNS